MKKTKPAHVGNVPATEPAENGSGIVTKKVIARAGSVSERQIENWMREKRIPYLKLSPRCVRFDLKAVMAALRRFEVPAARIE